MRPTEYQSAVLHCEGRFILINANAGATKTTTLALKAAQEVRNGLRPTQVLGITYTLPAVLAFEQRLRDVRAPTPQRIRVRSFNQLCLRRFEEIEAKVPYYREANSTIFRMVGMAIANARRSAEDAGFGSDFCVDGDGTRAIPDFLAAFRRLKGTMALQRLNGNSLTPQAAADLCGEDFTQLAVLRAYERLRLGIDEFKPGDLLDRASRGITAPLFRYQDDPCHDMAVQLCSDDPCFTWDDHPLRLNLRLILLDEGHDMNEAMFIVLQKLVELNEGVQVLGVIDRDQVLHTGSGADARFMMEEFRRWIGEPEPFDLPECRRCGPSVTELLAIHANKSYESAAGLETDRRIEQVSDASTLAGRIAFEHRQIAATHGSSDGRMAVLLRHPGACVDLELALGDTGTAYRTHGFDPYFLRPEIQVLRSLVAWATGNIVTLENTDTGGCATALAEFTGFNDFKGSDTAGVSFQGLSQVVLGTDPAGFATGQKGAARIDDSEERFLPGLRRFVGALTSGAAPTDLEALFDGLGFEVMCRRALVFDETVKDAMHSARQFAVSAARFKTFDDWLKIIADNEAENAREASSSVINLYSIPESKGLEFDHVIIPDVDAGDFDGSNEEERNLFYVAVSRARQRLTITYRREPSSYLVAAAGDPANWMLQTSFQT